MNVRNDMQSIFVSQGFEEFKCSFANNNYKLDAIEDDFVKFFAKNEALRDKTLVAWI